MEVLPDPPGAAERLELEPLELDVLFDDARDLGLDRQLRPALHTQLFEDAVQIHLHCAFRDLQPRRYVAVLQSVAHQGDDLALPLRQHPVRNADLGEAVGDRLVDPLATGSNLVDALDEKRRIG